MQTLERRPQLDKVRIESIDDAVGQYAEAGVRYMEITEQLSVVRVEVVFPEFAFD